MSVSDNEDQLGLLEPVGGGDPILLSQKRIVIGRRESSDIRLRFPNVSSTHCELTYEQGHWTVRDLNSRNGVKVNGSRVNEKRVFPGDEISVAKHRFKIQYTPRPRSGDVDVEELQEDIMKMSLLERAGLSSRDPEPKPRSREQKAQDEDAAMRFLMDDEEGPSS